MRIGEERSLGVLVIAPVGRVDSTTSSELEEVLLARVGSGERRVVELDSPLGFTQSALAGFDPQRLALELAVPEPCPSDDWRAPFPSVAACPSLPYLPKGAPS